MGRGALYEVYLWITLLGVMCLKTFAQDGGFLEQHTKQITLLEENVSKELEAISEHCLYKAGFDIKPFLRASLLGDNNQKDMARKIAQDEKYKKALYRYVRKGNLGYSNHDDPDVRNCAAFAEGAMTAAIKIRSKKNTKGDWSSEDLTALSQLVRPEPYLLSLLAPSNHTTTRLLKRLRKQVEKYCQEPIEIMEAAKDLERYFPHDGEAEAYHTIEKANEAYALSKQKDQWVLALVPMSEEIATYNNLNFFEESYSGLLDIYKSNPGFEKRLACHHFVKGSFLMSTFLVHTDETHP